MAVINNPALAQAAQNLSDIFRPPSGADLAGYASASATRQQAQRMQELFASGMTPSERAALTGVQNFGQTPEGFRFDVDTRSGDHRYNTDMVAATDTANNVRDNQRATITSLFGPLDEGQIAPAVPENVMGAVGLPAIDQRTGLPARPLTDDEILGAVLDGMDPEMQQAIAFGNTAVETVQTPNGPRFETRFGSIGQAPATAPGSDPSAAEEQIGRLSQQFIDTGLTADPAEARNLAIGIVDNRYTVSRHPVTGEALVLDVATGQPVSRGASGGQTTSTSGGTFDGAFGAVEGATDPTLDAIMRDEESPFGERYSNSPEAFGVGGALTGGINTVFDAVGAGAPYPEVQQTQSDFAVLRESLLNDIGAAYDRQPPSWLLQNIQALTPRAGNVFEGAGTAQSKLTAIGRQLTDELGTAEETLRGELSPTNRQEIETRVIGLRAAIGRVTDALQSFGGQGQEPAAPAGAPEAPQPGAVENGYRFNGGDPADPSNWERVE